MLACFLVLDLYQLHSYSELAAAGSSIAERLDKVYHEILQLEEELGKAGPSQYGELAREARRIASELGKVLQAYRECWSEKVGGTVLPLTLPADALRRVAYELEKGASADVEHAKLLVEMALSYVGGLRASLGFYLLGVGGIVRELTLVAAILAAGVAGLVYTLWKE